jgi:hypothetical protein
MLLLFGSEMKNKHKSGSEHRLGVCRTKIETRESDQHNRRDELRKLSAKSHQKDFKIHGERREMKSVEQQQHVCCNLITVLFMISHFSARESQCLPRANAQEMSRRTRKLSSNTICFSSSIELFLYLFFRIVRNQKPKTLFSQP